MEILIAEDDLGSRMLLEKTLTNLGYKVHICIDGEEAWKAIEKKHYQVVITDWMMPNMDGLELCRKIRSMKRNKYTYVIFLTAKGGKLNLLEGMDAGADDYLTKPFDSYQLRVRLRVAERILSMTNEIQMLEGLLPICSYCKKIQSDKAKKDDWSSVEKFISQRSEADFTHTICPGCYKTIVEPELQRLKEKKGLTDTK